MQYSLIDLLSFFLIYGFSGFILECAFRSIVSKSLFIQGGFLTNIFCPLYGFCALVINQIYTLSEITYDNKLHGLLIATFGSMLTVTFLEYAVGRILDRVLHHKMWDYSENILNLHSYICLEFTLLWGVLALVLSSFIHPIVEVAVFAVPETLKYNIVPIILSALFVNSSYNLRKLYPSHSRLIKN